LNHPKADPEKRAMFCQEIDKLKSEGKPIVYIDESGFAHDMPRTHGYSMKGKRCYGTHDWGARGRTNAIGALINGLHLTSHWIVIWIREYRRIYMLGAAELATKLTRAKHSCDGQRFVS
jgi:hypothetical protein